jgi:hypothetical protein
MSMSSDENPVHTRYVQARSSLPSLTALLSPSREKRVSPSSDDEKANSHDFQLVANQKKTVAILNNDSNAPVNSSSSAGLGVNNAPQVQTVSDLRQITDSCISTDAATRYALTRFPFPSFTIRFNRPNVNISQIKSDLLAHASDIH